VKCCSKRLRASLHGGLHPPSFRHLEAEELEDAAAFERLLGRAIGDGLICCTGVAGPAPKYHNLSLFHVDSKLFALHIAVEGVHELLEVRVRTSQQGDIISIQGTLELLSAAAKAHPHPRALLLEV
jgi:hypothetical protein